MDMRYRDMRGMDGRRLPPRNSRGEFRRRRSRRGDRGMDYAQQEDMRMREMDMRRGDYRGDYRGDIRSDYERQGGMDGHHYPQGQMGGYQPVEFMGYCNGYYGMPEQDYARGGRRDYGYDMRYDMRGGYDSRREYDRRGGRDYADYDDYGDYGETLSEKELEEWCHKLKSQLDEREKQMFSKETISQKAKQMGKPMEGFGEKELEVATLMVYTDYKNTIGQNPDIAIKLAYDWLTDKDVAVKGAEKLAVYYDCIVQGEDE